MPAGIAPHVSIRTLRRAHGLTIAELTERINELSTRSWDADHINHVELGSRQPSPALARAWAHALGIEPVDLRTDAQLRDLLAATEDAA